MSNITRKSFFKLMGGAAAVSLLAACKKDNVTPVDAAIDAPAGCTSSDATCTIANNHPHAPHVLVVTSADVAAGVDKTYSIMGAASHDHMVTVTAAQFTMLKGGGTITSTSTMTLSHTHDCTVSCG